MSDGEAVLKSIHSALKWLVLATVILYLATALVAFKTYSEANTSRKALCALRANLEGQITATRAFLAENPQGIPGFRSGAIRTSTQNQVRAVDALGIVSC